MIVENPKDTLTLIEKIMKRKDIKERIKMKKKMEDEFHPLVEA